MRLLSAESEKYHSKINKFREKYGAIIITLLCLYNVYVNWNTHLSLTIFFIMGVLICGTISVFDLKRAKQNKNS